MNTADLQPIQHESALLLKNKNILVIADLHIGIESELRQHGLHVPSQTSSMEKRLLSLLEKYKIKELILLGDIKHNIPSSTKGERKDVMRFFDLISPFGTIHIVPGNHDGNIGNLLPSTILLHPSNGCIIDDIGFIHGHRWPRDEVMKCDHLVIAHTHPTIMLTDRLGHKTFEPCWVRAKCIPGKLHKKYPDATDPDVLVIPAFNPLCGGNAINQEKITGPLGSVIDTPNADVYLLDGTLLGKVIDIK